MTPEEQRIAEENDPKLLALEEETVRLLLAGRAVTLWVGTALRMSISVRRLKARLGPTRGLFGQVKLCPYGQPERVEVWD